MDKENVEYTYNVTSFGHKKERNPATCKDKLHGIYAKWIKSERKKQILLCDLTYMWNLFLKKLNS